MNITGNTRTVFLLASPIAHVQTPQAMNALCDDLSIDAVTVPIDVAPDGLGAFFRAARTARNVAGVIVTMPHKIAAAALCDELGEQAGRAGAVNVVRFDSYGGPAVGELFDGTGFVSGLTQQKHSLKDKDILLLGAGGAASAIAFSCAKEQPRSLVIANRDRSKAEDLAERVRNAFKDIDVRAGDAETGSYEIVINGTSTGMKADDPLIVNPDLLRRGTLVAEIIMKPKMTPLLEEAERRGCTIQQGSHMLSAQISLFVDHLRLRA